MNNNELNPKDVKKTNPLLYNFSQSISDLMDVFPIDDDNGCVFMQVGKDEELCFTMKTDTDNLEVMLFNFFIHNDDVYEVAKRAIAAAAYRKGIEKEN